MLKHRHRWLERLANWGTAIAIPLVAVAGFRLLLAAREPSETTVLRPPPAPPAPGRLLVPPVDPSAPPVVELHPSNTQDADCAAGADRSGVAARARRCAPR
jgi:hypothetical protein